MKLLSWIYKKTKKKEPPYYYSYSLITIIAKPIRKWFTNVVAANCPFNCVRILIYRMCGFKIGKSTFIGMHCYLDDMCYDLMTIGSNVIISYGVYFACHGWNQGHNPIVIEDNAYIGMGASIVTKNSENTSVGTTIGKNAVVGACTLVNRDVPPHTTVVGIPCRIVKQKSEEKTLSWKT